MKKLSQLSLEDMNVRLQRKQVSGLFSTSIECR